MDAKKTKRTRRIKVRFVHGRSIAASTFAAAFAIGLACADESATILNRAFAGSTDTGLDLALTIVAVDSVPVDEEQPQVQLAPGKHSIEVLCATRVFGGMGRADLSTKASISAELQAGHVYQLHAEASERGDCAPQLKLQ